MGVMASQITSLTFVYSTVYPSAGQRKHQNSASLAFVQGNLRWLVSSPHKWPVKRKMFPFDDVIIQQVRYTNFPWALYVITWIHFHTSDRFVWDGNPEVIDDWPSKMISNQSNITMYFVWLNPSVGYELWYENLRFQCIFLLVCRMWNFVALIYLYFLFNNRVYDRLLASGELNGILLRHRHELCPISNRNQVSYQWPKPKPFCYKSPRWSDK